MGTFNQSDNYGAILPVFASKYYSFNAVRILLSFQLNGVDNYFCERPR